MSRPREATDAPSESEQPPLLEVRDLHVHFPVRKGLFGGELLRAVDGVSFVLERGETLGLVGESGSGKSTTGRAVVHAETPTSGEVRLAGRPLSEQKGRELRHERRRFQMVFQDPYASLNPRHTIGTIVAEPLIIHAIGDRESRTARVAELLELVGLAPEFSVRHPHALSGGQRQRVAIARALAAEPDLIVCDEAVSSLDVSVQAQIVNLLERLQDELGVAYLFIAHDLAVVRHIADRVAVMYLGTIVEISPAQALYARPLHPYTKALLSAVPVPDAEIERARRRVTFEGDLPNPVNPPSGCRFRTRCPWARERCAAEAPLLRQADDGHRVACHFYEEIDAQGGVAPDPATAS